MLAIKSHRRKPDTGPKINPVSGGWHTGSLETSILYCQNHAYPHKGTLLHVYENLFYTVDVALPTPLYIKKLCAHVVAWKTMYPCLTCLCRFLEMFKILAWIKAYILHCIKNKSIVDELKSLKFS